ncbi:CCR4-NOT transcription complex subunit 2 [Entomortierella parvispora]|uniref:CCR4-NOT transcription complex subunit 2 n=1 Tax=Entomortierella parvispora TaxID=205924 RepID=A0A9P3HGH0_9FUNG|nr:CCR4-NOT transcription complex subunit 2 [Entomortierella parvispora]
MQTPQQQQQFQQHLQQQQQRASAMQAAAGRMPNGRHGSFEMSQPSQGWAYGSGPLQGMNQARPPMSGFPNMMQSSMLQQQQQQQQSHSHPSHQQEILDMSDFPALGSANNASSNPGLSASYASTAGTIASSNAAAAANLLSQEFSIEDDFPALPGARPNSAGSSRQFNATMQQQLHQQQQQQQQQNSSRSQQSLQHHPSQQAQHLLQQSQLDGMGAFSSLLSSSSGSQMQSLQMQQQLANELMYQQQQQHQQQQSLAQQQMLHLNGSHSPLNSHIASSPGDLGKATKSYATKASNGSGSGLFSSSLSSPLSAPSSAVPSTTGQSATSSQTGTTQSGAASNTSRQNDTAAPSKDLQNAAGSNLERHDRFGLFGMLGVIRMADQDSTTLTLGRDLTTLGLSLNSADPLYGTFASPWFEVPASSDVEAEFHVPACYNVQPPPSAQAKLSSVMDETLFYMFYSMPRDALQDAAAAELYNRQWRYHKELRLWLMKDQTSEQSKTPTFERGSYIFFDPNSWEKVKKDFIVMYDALEERRQGPPPTLQQSNGSGNSAVGGGPNGSGVSAVNGMEGAHAGLLNNLNMTASTAGPGSSSLSGAGGQQGQQLKQSGLSQNFQMQQQQQQQQRQQQQQQQQQHQKSLHMMNHGLFAPNNNHGFQGVKPQ